MRRDARDPARKLAEGRCDFAELVRSAFELAERSGLICRRSRDVLRPFTIPARYLCDARDALAETPNLGLLHARRVGDANPGWRHIVNETRKLVERVGHDPVVLQRHS